MRGVGCCLVAEVVDVRLSPPPHPGHTPLASLRLLAPLSRSERGNWRLCTRFTLTLALVC